MVQPQPSDDPAESVPKLEDVGCVGRIIRIAETGDGRYMLGLFGIARFRIASELPVSTLYRQCRVDYGEFAGDLLPVADDGQIDRAGVLDALRAFARAKGIELDWRSIDLTPNENLVNALSMMSPFGPREKQALLEARDVKSRAEVLIAITEIELARGGEAPTTLQ
jgi:Lon protease-like protein